MEQEEAQRGGKRRGRAKEKKDRGRVKKRTGAKEGVELQEAQRGGKRRGRAKQEKETDTGRAKKRKGSQGEGGPRGSAKRWEEQNRRG